MDDQGGGSAEVEVRLGRQVVVGQLLTTGGILPGVQQQSNFQGCSDERVMEVQVGELIASSGFGSRDKTRERSNGVGVRKSREESESQMAERLENRAINLKVAGSIPGRAK